MLPTFLLVLAIGTAAILVGAFVCVLTRSTLRNLALETWKKRNMDLQRKAFVQAFSPVGTKVTLRTYEKGKYGRWLADIKVGNKWLCSELIAHHHAVEYHGQNKDDIRAAHLANRKLVVLG